ncbi:MAG: phospho-N-acetylmuramoyl-pentapeptide-transferase [Clostridia bacterium]|nr:phospho-N-acetylmuramoyl-pentapeptide-transferase [Clostridia bacterium]
MDRYIPIIGAAAAFLVTALSGYIIIPFLHKLKFGQTILDIGPKWHKKKQGTPTMGGIMMVIGVVFAFVCCYTVAALSNGKLFTELKDPRRCGTLIAGIVMALLMSLIGFLDDYIKVVKKRNLGLTAKQKTFLQLFVSGAYLLTLWLCGMKETHIPFLGSLDISSGFDLLFWPIALMFIYGFTNAVNLTDGLDGLASSVTLIVACAFMLVAGGAKATSFSTNALSAALAGACAGFLVWNIFPAKVFMGDTGSMFLGGMVVAVSFGIDRPVLLLLAGFMYFVEAISVMLQVAYYKKTKKRLFKMAPLHHHFEMSGWSEQSVVLLFTMLTLIGCVLMFILALFG